MRLDCVIALSIASTLALAGTALAQQPAPSPAPPSGPPADYGAPISNEQAKAVAGAAFAEAKKNNWRMAIAIAMRQLFFLASAKAAPATAFACSLLMGAP